MGIREIFSGARPIAHPIPTNGCSTFCLHVRDSGIFVVALLFILSISVYLTAQMTTVLTASPCRWIMLALLIIPIVILLYRYANMIRCVRRLVVALCGRAVSIGTNCSINRHDCFVFVCRAVPRTEHRKAGNVLYAYGVCDSIVSDVIGATVS